jgi:hypothetical protein
VTLLHHAEGDEVGVAEALPDLGDPGRRRFRIGERCS